MTEFDQVFELGPPFRNIEFDWWDQLEQHPAAAELLAEGWADASVWLLARAGTAVLSRRSLQALHRAVFRALFPELAGRLRGPAPNHLPVNVDFGQHRGTPYEQVPDELERLDAGIRSLIGQLDDRRAEAPPRDIAVDVMTAAAYVHCELVRIHPFPNGNGRIARLAINYFCYRYGFYPIAIERPRGEYLDAIRAWLYYRKIEPCADFLGTLVEIPPD